MDALIVSLLCLFFVAGDPQNEPAGQSKAAETSDDTAPSLLRVWSARTGDQQIEAEFVRIRRGYVLLKMSEGRIATAPIEKFSEPDQQWLRKNSAKVVDFEWESESSLPRADTDRKQHARRIVHRLSCRPLASTLAKEDPIRFVLHWTRAWHVPAHGPVPETHQTIPDSGLPVEKLDTLNSLTIHLITPAGQRFRLRANMRDDTPEAQLGHGLGNTLYLTIAADALTETEHVHGEWTSGNIAGFHDLGWYSVKVEGSLISLGTKDLSIPFSSAFFNVKRVADGRKELAEIEAIARAEVAEVRGVAHARGLPGHGIPTAVVEAKNGNRQVIFAGESDRTARKYWVFVELTPQGDLAQVKPYPIGRTRGDKLLRQLFLTRAHAMTIWPKPTDDH